MPRGVPVADAKVWAAELGRFDWQALQDEINAWPQLIAEIDGGSIHVLHARSARDDAVPLLILHGWPGTVVELLDLLPALTAPDSPDDQAFHVVIPSHPAPACPAAPTSPGGVWTAPPAPTPS